MQNNDFIRISYLAKIKETNSEFDKSENAPVIVGSGYTIRGLEEALKEMNVGEKKIIEIPPEKAFGSRNHTLIKLIAITEFRRHGTKPVPGMFVEADNLRGRVLSVSSGRVRVDFNHPLAGKTLMYDLEIKNRIEKTEDKVKAIIEIYTRVKDKVNVKIIDKDVEIEVPPLINSLFKKKIADDVMKFLSLDKIKFVEIFEKPKPVEEKRETQ